MIGDLLALARLLARRAPGDWGWFADQALSQAHAADKFRKRYGRVHGRWGDGSLLGWCLLRGEDRARVDFSDQMFCRALAQAIAALAQWRLNRSRG